MVLYEDAAAGLEDAYDAVLDCGFSTLRQGNKLAVWSEDGPMLFVSFACGEAVRQASTQIGLDTPYADELSQCDARIEITFDDLDEVRTEVETLVEVQAALQETTQGFIFNTWNRKLAPP